MMRLKQLLLSATLIGAAVGLAACGGGGGGGAAEPRAPIRVTITADASSLLSNKGEVFYEPGSSFATNLNVQVRQSNGQAVANGTVVALSVSSSANGSLSTTDDLATRTTQIQVPTTAGDGQAVFHTAEGTGNTTITASVTDPGSNQNISASVTLTVNEGPDGVNRITLTPNRLVIPARPPGVPIFFDSPYTAEVNLEFRLADGTIGAPDGGTMSIGISPLNIAAFSTLDDPSTDDVNEFFVLLGNGPVDLAANGKVFVHSFDSPGIVTVTASAFDGETQQTFDAEIQIEVVESGSDGRPANLSFGLPSTPQYVQGAGGTSAQTVQVSLTDGANEFVAEPGGANNNIFLEIFTETPDSGAVLRGTNGGGTAVEGTSIALATTGGIASVSLVSGTEPGLVRLRAVADAADNNVSNGVQAAVVTETSLAISDGIPFSVTLTSIPINSLTVNPVDPSVVVFDDDGFPVGPNATYSLRVNAIVTDRFGNPPAQPVSLQAGLIDAPISGFPTQGAGTFDLSGGDGDPFEGGTAFFAPTGQFRQAGGGAGPGDTLILFGKEVVGNADHESARTVTQAIDNDDLTVDEPFNFNDTVGGSIDSGAVIPYVIGRATTGNIESSFVTDSNGVGSTLLNYPVSQLGRSAALYVQGANSGLGSAGNLGTYADATLLRYPGLRPLAITATPGSIPGNVPTSVLVCVEDAATAPIRGQFIGFAFSNLQGTGSVDGVVGSGTVANPTGADGCTVALVETSGLGTDAEEGLLQFFTGGQTADVIIVPPSSAVLQASPSSFRLGGFVTTVNTTLRYLSGGAGVANIAISGSCTASNGTISITTQPDPTDANGETTALITAQLDDGTFGTTPGDGSCTFEATDGTQATVDFLAVDVCANLVNVSPGPPPGACADTANTTFNVQVQFDNSAMATLLGEAVVTADGAPINCAFPANNNRDTCSATVNIGQTIVFSLAFSNQTDQDNYFGIPTAPNPSATSGFAGECRSGGRTLQAEVSGVVNDSICIVRF
ncbi:MAG: hypothetical protein AB8B96_04895 [Lysobacterales bacterium]